MLKADFRKLLLHFRKPSGTSRGILHEKCSWFIRVWDPNEPEICGWGEVGHLDGLSIEPFQDMEEILKEVCSDPENPNWLEKGLYAFPSVRFALEQALIDLDNGGKKLLFSNDFSNGTRGISINGLVWMGPIDDMRKQVKEKIELGYTCVKIKIGALNFEEEIGLLKEIRKEFSPEEIELRVDANGAFQVKEAPKKLEALAKLKLHSIEQPIKAGQHEAMAALCKNPPIPIALDEELIGIADPAEKETLLERIAPQFIILKPSLVGGFRASEEWILSATRRNIGWWVTSALESNIGLNAIAQWTASLDNPMPQGLGTGQLYTNNFPSPLQVENGYLNYLTDKNWEIRFD